MTQEVFLNLLADFLKNIEFQTFRIKKKRLNGKY